MAPARVPSVARFQSIGERPIDSDFTGRTSRPRVAKRLPRQPIGEHTPLVGLVFPIFFGEHHHA